MYQGIDPRLAAPGFNPYGEGSVVLSRTGEEGYSDSSMRAFFAMLLRRRGLFLAVMALVLGATLVYLWLTPPIYEATATMQVNGAESGGGGDQGSSNNSLVVSGMPGPDRSIGTQLTIIQSDQVRRLARQSLPPDLNAKLVSYSETDIQQVNDTNLIEVKVGSHDPTAAAAYANAICDAYIQLSRTENRGQLQAALDYVTAQKDKVGKRLEAARSQVQQYKERYGIFDINSEAGSVVSTAHDLQNQIEATREERNVNQAELSTVTQMIPQMPKIQQWPGAITTRPEVSAMKGQITQLELKRLELLQKYRPERPEIKAIDLQIESIRDTLKGQAKTEISSWSNNPNPIRSSLETQLVGLQVKNWSLQAREAALAQAAQRANARLAQLPTRERQMEEMTMNLDALADSYTALNNKQESLRMMQEARMANASKLFPAEPPRNALGRMTRFIASALLVGLLLGLALVALVDWLDDGVYSEAEAKMVAQLPILAQIPLMSGERQERLMSTVDAPPSDTHLAHLRENFRMLRTVIALSSPVAPDAYALPAGNGANGNGRSNGTDGQSGGGKFTPFGTSAIRSVVITSSLPNEGKSVSSTNLATAAALSGERVILIDCDLRHPGVHEFFDLRNDIGLTSVVSGACTLEEALQSTRIPTLKVLSTGPLMGEPLQVLNSPGARALFDQVEKEFDFIVVDTPPALVFAEAQIIAAMTDAMLLVISSQDAKKREVARTRDLFDQSGLMPLGAILNKLPPGSEGYYYGQYMEQYAANYN
jgi:capsular exopolysaccharide synthesis family protein